MATISNTVSPFGMFSKGTSPLATPRGGQSPATVGMSTPAGPKQVPLVSTPPVPSSKAAAVSVAPRSTSLITPPKSQPTVASTIPSNVDQNLFMKPGETPQQYNARVASYQAGSTTQPASFNTFPGLVNRLATAATTASPEVTQAQQNLAEALKRQQQLESGIAGQRGGIESEAIPLEFQQGREQALARQFAGQEAAAQGAVTGAQTGLQAALTGQGQRLGAIQQAAGLAQPQLGGIGQVPFSPTDLSQGAILGTTQPGGVSAAGQLLGQLQGAQTAGAAAGGIQATQEQQIAGYKSAQQQGQNLVSQLNDLITTFGLNPSDINAVNAGIQKIAQNTSSPQYKTLVNYLNDIATRYSQILTPPGGSATDTTRSIAQGMLDATASGKSIQSVLQALDQQASAVIAGVPATGTVPTAPGGASNGGSTSGFGWNG